jgi:hypothetical protein
MRVLLTRAIARTILSGITWDFMRVCGTGRSSRVEGRNKEKDKIAAGRQKLILNEIFEN